MSIQKIKSYPIKINKTFDGTILSRGIAKFKISDELLFETIEKIITLTKESITQDWLIAQFDIEQQSVVQDLLKILIDKNIIYFVNQDDDESLEQSIPHDIFYWHFRQSTHQQRKILGEIKLLLIGNSETSYHLHHSLKFSGFNDISYVNDPALSCIKNINIHINKEMISLNHFLAENNKKYDGVIFSSDFNEISRAQFWNKFCLDNNWQFMPIILNNLQCHIGPFVIPHDTACYECLLKRQNSNLYLPELAAIDMEPRQASTPNIHGYHPLMPSISASIAAMQLASIYTKIPPYNNIGKLTTIDFVKYEMKNHKVLRLPRCKSCMR